MDCTILVTGARGKTGRRLIPRLLDRGAAVRAASHNPAPAADVEPVRFDWHDESTHPGALRGVDAVYLVSPHLTGTTVDAATQVEPFLRRAAEVGVRRVVLLSSFGVNRADPRDPLRRLELLVERSGIPGTILRPAAFMQNFSENHWSGLVRSIRERDEIPMPGGFHPVSYVSTHDIAAVAATALTEDGHEGMGYTLTGPAALTLHEVAGHISLATGRRIRHVETAPETLRDALLTSGAPPDFADYAARLYLASVTSGAMTQVTPDITLVTGNPPTPFARYAANAAAAWHR